MTTRTPRLCALHATSGNAGVKLWVPSSSSAPTQYLGKSVDGVISENGIPETVAVPWFCYVVLNKLARSAVEPRLVNSIAGQRAMRELSSLVCV